MTRVALFAILIAIPAFGQKPTRKDLGNGRISDSGLITPLDNRGMYIRNATGTYTVLFGRHTQVALEVNFRQFGNFNDGLFTYEVPSAKQKIAYKIPDGPISATRPVMHEKDLADIENEKWLPPHGMRVFFNTKLPHAKGSKDKPYAGTLTLPPGRRKPAKLTVNGIDYEVSMKKGGQTSLLLFGVVSLADCKPFIHRARVIGKVKGDVIAAEEIHLMPIGDQVALDDPNLPRYLFIGDSISGNYDQGLRAALAGRANVHHPPTNCGPVQNGVANLHHWLGAYKQKGRHWDVISFNFGHWNAGSTKADYQRDLEFVCRELKKTGAKLIWVTTAPVPNGYPPAGDLASGGKAPGRTAGVMKKYLNPWAMEVIEKHPEIAVHDQWKFVHDHRNEGFKKWWAGNNVHFNGAAADALGKHLAQDILKILQK